MNMNKAIIKSKIKKGDTVQIMAGKDSGKKGLVEKVLLSESKVLVKGVNLVKKHVKPKGQQQPGQIITMEKPISIANAMVICPNCKKSTRIGYKTIAKTKQRVCKKCEQVIEIKKEEKTAKK